MKTKEALFCKIPPTGVPLGRPIELQEAATGPIWNYAQKRNREGEEKKEKKKKKKYEPFPKNLNKNQKNYLAVIQKIFTPTKVETYCP